MEDINNNPNNNSESDSRNDSDNANDSRLSGPWWKSGALVFSEISTWIVVPIVLALIIGKRLDARYGTDPWIFIGLAALGFLITAYGIVKSVKKYAEKEKGKEKKEVSKK